ncbi:MAG: hypothetical protein KAX49_18335 [Halanaerobiales bacterium]|nr:hypothetical protein [Halanaerobiales bacterium]
MKKLVSFMLIMVAAMLISLTALADPLPVPVEESNSIVPPVTVFSTSVEG